jgi:hypothetical protein
VATVLIGLRRLQVILKSYKETLIVPPDRPMARLPPASTPGMAAGIRVAACRWFALLAQIVADLIGPRVLRF